MEELRAQVKTIRADAKRKKFKEDLEKLEGADEEGTRLDDGRNKRLRIIEKKWAEYHAMVKLKTNEELKRRQEEEGLRQVEDANRKVENDRRAEEDSKNLLFDHEWDDYLRTRRHRRHHPHHRHSDTYVLVPDESQLDDENYSEGGGEGDLEEETGQSMGLRHVHVHGHHVPHPHMQAEVDERAHHHWRRRSTHHGDIHVVDTSVLGAHQDLSEERIRPTEHQRRRQSREGLGEQRNHHDSNDQPRREESQEPREREAGQQQESEGQDLPVRRIYRPGMRGGGNSDDDSEPWDDYEALSFEKKRFRQLDLRL